jgi:peptidoglycan hydrolase-like protein with peptidoglycan-binding domain
VAQGSSEEPDHDSGQTSARTDPLWGDAERGGPPDRHTVDSRVDATPSDPDAAWTSGTEDGGGDTTGRLTISTLPDSVSPHYDSARQTRLMSNRPRQWPRVLAGLAMLAAGAAVAYFVLDLDAFDDSGDDAAPAPSTAAPTTSEVAVDEGPAPFARLTHGAPAVITAPRSGPLTGFGDVGETVRRGETIAVVDGEPIIAMYGATPFERALEPGVAGDDVAQLQANLLALGVLDQGRLSVTGEYDRDTAAAVEAWQQSIGLAPTGVVPDGAVLAIDGPGVVDGALPAGTEVAAGDPLGSLAVTTAQRDIAQPGAGTVTGLLVPGTPIAHGDIVMSLDDTPVVAVTNGSPVDAAVIEAMASGENLQLEQVLSFFGFDPDGVMVVDEEGDLATIAAVNRWRRASGFGEAFAIGPQYYLEMPRDATVDATYIPDGAPIQPGTLVYTVSASTSRVVAPVPAEDAPGYRIGDVVTLETADGAMLETVVETIPEETVPAPDGSGASVVEVVLDPVGDAGDLAEGPLFLPDAAG